MNEYDYPIATPDTMIAYVDGSYNIKTKTYGAGAAIFYKGELTKYIKSGNDPEMAKMRNVAGEVMAAEHAMLFALNTPGVTRLVIYYDYSGVEAWCTGKWKTNKKGTIRYKRFYDEKVKPNLQVVFMKVKGHSGNQWNDLADEYAKEAAGI
jgi:ribonuclease HI